MAQGSRTCSDLLVQKRAPRPCRAPAHGTVHEGLAEEQHVARLELRVHYEGGVDGDGVRAVVGSVTARDHCAAWAPTADRVNTRWWQGW